MKTWILVADRARARVFERVNALADLVEFADFGNPEALQDTAELAPHLAAARGHDSSGPARHTIAPHTDPHDKVAQRFAAELAQVLLEGVRHHDCAAFVLIAPARFLGELRGELDATVASRVSASIDKDLTREPAERLRQQIDALKE